MTRKSFLKTMAGTAAAATARAQDHRRNLVFILSDDHRYDMLGAMGHPFLETPHMDRIISQGVHVKNAFVTTSLCSPSRASILSGQYMHAHNVNDNSTPLNRDLMTFPRVLQQQGYRTGFVGKWHMGGETDEPRPGFDRWISFRGQGAYFDPELNYDGQRRTVKGYNPDILTGEAKKFLRENKDRPFLLFLSHKAVHDDFSPAPRYKGSYRDRKIPYPASMADTDENYRGKPDWVRRQRQSWHGVDGLYKQRYQFDDFYIDYCECIRGLDDSVGEVYNELEELGLLNDTLFVYMGDNGFQHGEHGLIDKRTMYEPSIRVPMFAHCPDLFEGGRAVDGMALNLDIGPTLLDAAGAPAPPTMQGRSLLPLLRGDAPDWRTEFVYEYMWERAFPQTPTVIGLRTDRYSYMHYHGVWDLDELYDIQADPHQMNNLLADVRTNNEAGPLIQRLEETDHASLELVRDYQGRIEKVLRETGGRMEPTWSG